MEKVALHLGQFKIKEMDFNEAKDTIEKFSHALEVIKWDAISYQEQKKSLQRLSKENKELKDKLRDANIDSLGSFDCEPLDEIIREHKNTTSTLTELIAHVWNTGYSTGRKEL